MKFLLIFCTFSIICIKTLCIPSDTTYVKKTYDKAREYIESGNNVKAISLLEEIMAIKRNNSVDFNPQYFKLYNILGVLYQNSGRYQTALDYYRKALDATNDNDEKSLMYGNLGALYTRQGDYAKAINYYSYALALFEKSKQLSEKKVFMTYHNLGFAHYKAGQWEKSLYYYQRSINKAKENRIDELGDTYYNTGFACQKLGKLSEANQYYILSIQNYTNVYGQRHYKTAMSYINYAQYLLAVNDLAKSWEYYTKAYQVLSQTVGLKHPYTSICFKSMGDYCYSRKDYRRALSYYQQSLVSKVYSFNDSSIYANPSVDALPDMELLDILKLKAQAFEKLSEQENKTENLKAALATLELTSTLIERLRTGYLYEGSKLQLAAKEHEVYIAIIRIANSLYEITRDYKYTEIAFRYAEYSKYAVLRELKNEEMAKGVAGVPDSICDNERRVKQQIASIRMQVEEESKLERPNRSKIDGWNEQQFTLAQRLEGLMQRLESGYHEYYRLKYSNQVVSIPQLQKAMDKKEAILEYVLGDNELYTFAITKDTFLLLKQETDSIFRSKLDFYIYALHSGYSTDYRDYKSAAYSLYRKLILPVEHLLKGKNLLIIPDGKLSLAPFEAFTDKPYKEGDRCNYGTESYLLRKYPIGYAYSATLYSNSLSNGYKGSPSFLGIASDYKNSRDSLKSIPRGMRSVRKFAMLTQGKSLIGGNATEENFKKYCNSYGIVHFYAHGFEDTLNPANSKLALSTPTDSTEDGYLYAWEVYNMQLNAQMVVLGSCFSGSGRLSEGEGVLSISRSFMFAGSQSVVMSLWAAADRSTNDILNDYYLNLLKGMRKDEALRLAKLEYLTIDDPVDTHPRFWAGIVVNGNQKGLYHFWFLKRVIVAATIILALLLAFWKRRAIGRLVSRAAN